MCDSCDEIIQVGSSGFNGYSPIYANIEGTCDGSDVVVQQLVSWTGGTGLRPSYEGNTMTDAWLTVNPLYLGDSGWVEVLCDATNILGATGPGGTDGATGETGPQGPAGEDACVQDISFNISVDGSEEYPATVTPGGTTCAPSYAIEFPTTAFTTNTTIDTHIESLINDILSPDENISALNTIGTTSSSLVWVRNLSGTLPSLIPTSSSWVNFINYYKIGKLIILNVRLGLIGEAVNTTMDEIYIKIPDGYISENTAQYASLAIFNVSNGELFGFGSTVKKAGVITTNVDTPGWLSLKYHPADPIEYPILLNEDNDISFIGQIIFKTTT